MDQTPKARVELFTPATLALLDALGERDRQGRTNLARIAHGVGPDQAEKLLDQARQVEANGGMLTLNGSRKRTLGGIWARLAKEGMTDEQFLVTFGYARGKGQTAPAGPAEPPFSWTGRGVWIAAAEDKGDITSVKVQLMGRPKKIVQRAGCALIIMTDPGKLPVLPKGIPVPSKLPATDYIVWIGQKQWNKVKEAIGHPDDMLIVEGAQIYDREMNAISVFATNVTTKVLQQQQKQQK